MRTDGSTAGNAAGEASVVPIDAVARRFRIPAGPDASAAWQCVIRERIDSLGEQIDSMQAARDHLEHILDHHEHSPPDGCNHFEKLIWDPDAGKAASHW